MLKRGDSLLLRLEWLRYAWNAASTGLAGTDSPKDAPLNHFKGQPQREGWD